MGIFDRVSGMFRSAIQQGSALSSTVQSWAPAARSSDRYMPKFNGRDICDWVDDIEHLKRQGDLQQALWIAQECLNAMARAALQNPKNVMEFYVAQVAIIQHKMKDYEGELVTLDTWLGTGLPAPREDYRVDLRKRRAKARELVAKRNGEDASAFTAEWKHLVELEKAMKASVRQESAPSTGKSMTNPGVSYPRSSSRSGWVAPQNVLASQAYVAVDFETANRAGGASACQVALVKVSRGRIVERFTTLIKPPKGFDSFEFTYLHGISARDVRRSPMWLDIAQNVHRFVSGLPVYAHNASFDSGVWRDLDSHFRTRTRPTDFYCSYRTAQRLVPGLENYKLPTVTKALVPGYRLDHHRADSDAEACALIVAALQKMNR